MRIILLIFFTILLSCSKDISNNKNIEININENLSFDDFKKLIETKGIKNDYPDINKWKIVWILQL